jgi:hypothetical protein
MNAARPELESPRRRPSDSDVDYANDPRPIGEIANDIWHRAETLLRQEMKLGITDAQERLQLLQRDVEKRIDALKVELIAKATGGLVVFIGVLTLTAAIVLLLAEVMQPWLAALIVGIVVAGAGVLLLRKPSEPLSPLHTSELLPKRALESTKTDIHEIQEALK